MTLLETYKLKVTFGGEEGSIGDLNLATYSYFNLLEDIYRLFPNILAEFIHIECGENINVEFEEDIPFMFEMFKDVGEIVLQVYEKIVALRVECPGGSGGVERTSDIELGDMVENLQQVGDGNANNSTYPIINWFRDYVVTEGVVAARRYSGQDGGSTRENKSRLIPGYRIWDNFFGVNVETSIDERDEDHGRGSKRGRRGKIWRGGRLRGGGGGGRATKGSRAGCSTGRGSVELQNCNVARRKTRPEFE